MKPPFAHFIKAHHISRAALCAGVVVAAIVFFVVGAGLRLLWGPVSLGPLRGTLAGAIHEALPGINLDYDRAAVEWTRDQGRVNLVVLGARIADSKGRVVARAPKAAIDLAAAPFLKGQFVIKRITLVGVEFTLVHMKNGRIRLGNQKDAGDDDVIGRIRDVINAHGNEPSSLESFAVRNARLGFYDEAIGFSLTSPRANLVLRSTGQTIGTSFDADIVMGGRTSHTTIDLTMPPANRQGVGQVRGKIAITALDLRALGRSAKMFEAVKDIPVTASLSADFGADPTGKLAFAAFDLTARGEIPFAALKSKALHLGALRLVGRYDGASNRLALTTAELDAKEARARLKGDGALFYDANGRLERIHADLAGGNLALDMPGVFAQAVNYQSLA